MSGSINVEKAVEYLRHMEIDVSDELAAAWREQEKAMRLRRRRHRAELKRSCGHFSFHWSKVTGPNGSVWAKCCNACRRYVEFRDLRPEGSA